MKITINPIRKKPVLTVQETAEYKVKRSLHYFDIAIDGIKEANDLLVNNVNNNKDIITSLQEEISGDEAAIKANSNILKKLEALIAP